ncbi:MAG: endolytic transglycosylase MltG [bacterium]|nr:endolytic transglycosylase MltG [bacterium]
MKKTALIISGFLFFGLISSFLFFRTFPARASILIGDFKISTGMSFNEIVDKLKSENLIASTAVFKIYGVITGEARRLKPGKYALSSDFSISKLFGILTKGPEEISAVIAPGLTLKEIDEKLSEARIIKPGEIINFNINSLKSDYSYLTEAHSLEGFLFPDTYRFFPDSGADLVIHKFLDNFKTKALPLFKDNDRILDKLILASILEKEIPDYEEKKVAAGILLKRLKVGMPLQVDASVIYAKCSGRFLNCPRLAEADYKINSVYNTYLYPGLPEGPISNPDSESIKAVLNSEKTRYWYYLSDPKTKKTIFSETFDEHNKNRAAYLLNR